MNEYKYEIGFSDKCSEQDTVSSAVVVDDRMYACIYSLQHAREE